MKWFKHYTNAHKGAAIQALIPFFGKPRAYGLYFLFVEYLSDKWNGSDVPKFKLAKSELRSFLGLKQNKLSSFLVCLKNETKITLEENDLFFIIEFPKLLEIRHRDALPSGHRPEIIQPISRLEKNRTEKKNIIADWVLIAFDSLAAEYKKKFPETTTGPARSRFLEQIKTEADLADLKAAIANYRQTLDSQSWRSAKTTFANYLGTKRSGFFWRDYIAGPALEEQKRTIGGICAV